MNQLETAVARYRQARKDNQAAVLAANESTRNTPEADLALQEWERSNSTLAAAVAKLINAAQAHVDQTPTAAELAYAERPGYLSDAAANNDAIQAALRVGDSVQAPEGDGVVEAIRFAPAPADDCLEVGFHDDTVRFYPRSELEGQASENIVFPDAAKTTTSENTSETAASTPGTPENGVFSEAVKTTTSENTQENGATARVTPGSTVFSDAAKTTTSENTAKTIGQLIAGFGLPVHIVPPETRHDGELEKAARALADHIATRGTVENRQHIITLENALTAYDAHHPAVPQALPHNTNTEDDIQQLLGIPGGEAWSLLHEIYQRATRYRRGSAERHDLIDDLRVIGDLAVQMRAIIHAAAQEAQG